MGDALVRANVMMNDGTVWQALFFALPRVGEMIEAYDRVDHRLRVCSVNWAPIPDGSYKPTLNVQRA